VDLPTRVGEQSLEVTKPFEIAYHDGDTPETDGPGAPFATERNRGSTAGSGNRNDRWGVGDEAVCPLGPKHRPERVEWIALGRSPLTSEARVSAGAAAASSERTVDASSTGCRADIALLQPQPGESRVRRPAALMRCDKRLFGAGEVPTAQPYVAEFDERPAELSAHPRTQFFAGTERFGLVEITRTGDSEQLGAHARGGIAIGLVATTTPCPIHASPGHCRRQPTRPPATLRCSIWVTGGIPGSPRGWTDGLSENRDRSFS